MIEQTSALLLLKSTAEYLTVKPGFSTTDGTKLAGETLNVLMPLELSFATGTVNPAADGAVSLGITISSFGQPSITGLSLSETNMAHIRNTILR